MRELLSESRVRQWLALVGTASILIMTIYTLIQQSARLSANDVPRTTAETVKYQLESGARPSDVVPRIKTDLRKDAGTFVIVTDNAEHVLASSANLDGGSSLPPVGTFLYAKQHGTDHFTWQPKDGVRLATYMQSYGKNPADGFIVTGQSLRSTEDKVATYGWLSLAAWLAVIAWASLMLLVLGSTPKK